MIEACFNYKHLLRLTRAHTQLQCASRNRNVLYRAQLDQREACNVLLLVNKPSSLGKFSFRMCDMSVFIHIR